MSQVAAINYFFLNEGKLMEEKIPINFHMSPIQNEVLSCIFKNDAKLLEEVIKYKAEFSLNFNVNAHGLSPILLISAKGSIDLLNAIMLSKHLDINFSDRLGSNSF